MPPPQGPASAKQLLVEGNDYLNFFEALATHLEVDDIQVQNFGGVDDLRAFLRAFVSQSEFRQRVRRLGIVRDAERHADRAFQSVQGSLRAAGLPVPDVPCETAGSEPATSVLILPGQNEPGMLETLLCETFAATADADCVDGFFECASNLAGVSIARPDKARAQAWLAMRPNPHLSVGVAAKAGYWNLEHHALEPVRDFLRSL